MAVRFKRNGFEDNNIVSSKSDIGTVTAKPDKEIIGGEEAPKKKTRKEIIGGEEAPKKKTRKKKGE